MKKLIIIVLTFMSGVVNAAEINRLGFLKYNLLTEAYESCVASHVFIFSGPGEDRRPSQTIVNSNYHEIIKVSFNSNPNNRVKVRGIRMYDRFDCDIMRMFDSEGNIQDVSINSAQDGWELF